jgi:2-keto-4-pentenoate hydratase/2-oxohepta-3-ene-1,7-dioic acid hydratase in catechol pathway
MTVPERFVRVCTTAGVQSGRQAGDRIEMLSAAPWDSPRVTGVIAADGAALRAPCRPGKVICLGVNYHDHATEFGHAIPDCPLIFMKAPSAVIGPEEAIVYPSYWTTRVEYEAELALVIGQQARRVAARNAADVIFGYTCLNDVTARDLQRRDGQWTRGKSFDTFCPIGPAIVRGIDPANLAVRGILNGVVKQSSSTTHLIFGVPEIIAFVSHVMTLEPGDVIATGTPAGVGPLQPGDVVDVEIEQIGRLRNRVVRGAPGCWE